MWKLAFQGILQGPPVPMGRPRFTKSGRAYTAQTSRTYKNKQVQHLEASKGKDWTPLDGILRIQINFIHPRTKRLIRYKGDLSQGRIWRPKKPDIDNLIKMVLDIITQSEVWVDDNRVVSISCEDYYAGEMEEAHTLFSIYQWRKEDEQDFQD
jgi:Holliday junction resolvase RusA-like endonuclease